jgi:hypothetical protein
MQKSKTKQPKPAARASAGPKPQPTKKLNLTDFQTFVCDRVSDLLLRGGHEHDMDNVLCGALGHYYRTMFPRKRMGDCVEQEQKRVTEYIDSRIEEWRTPLIQQWPLLKDHEETEFKGVMQQVFARWNRELWTQLEEFMVQAGSDDKRLLHEVLERWNGGSYRIHDDDYEVGLANYFAAEASDPHTYFKVPDRISGLVQAYITLLLGGKDGKDKPAEDAA